MAEGCLLQLHDCLAEVRAAQQEWAATHAASLRPLHQAAAATPPRLSPPATLSAELLLGVAAAEARHEATRGAALPALHQAVAQHAALLERMYAAASAARALVAALPCGEACVRPGDRFSPAELCATLSAPLGAYEMELQLKQSCVHELRAGRRRSAQQAQMLVITWESQPMLEPVEGMWAGLEEEEALREARRTVPAP
ncbi:hypothetical protein AB1Y20_003246 [Prymnesium parvum]|uniref:Uncharacterized protein n=1 Tax=Prymnesium parvum TaxID=97485 RepID=A0AB34JDY9_PRYPA